MTQYIDKSAVVAEITKRFDEYSNSILRHYDACTEARASELGKILTILDTFEVKEVDEEPVSEEWEEAAKRYAIESYPDEPSIGQFGTGDYELYVDMSGQRECAVEDFKAGAKWQKEQDQSTIELAEDHAMLAGMEKMKEEMMANTADAIIGLPYENKDGGYTQLIDVSRPLPVGNNKIAIIFKED